MTRLTSDHIHDLPNKLADYDARLLSVTGLDLRGLAFTSSGLQENKLNPGCFRVAVIPVTSGQGQIAGFSKALCAVTEYIGFLSFITAGKDVCGLVEAYRSSADIILLADDNMYAAINLKSGFAVDNDQATALGYAIALDRAAAGISGKDVLLIGAGLVGSKAAVILAGLGAHLTIFDQDPSRELVLAHLLHKKYDFQAVTGLNQAEALSGAKYIFDASDSGAFINEDMLQEEVIISAPGIPLSLDDKALAKHSERLIHDPLQIGTAVMLYQVLAGLNA